MMSTLIWFFSIMISSNTFVFSSPNDSYCIHYKNFVYTTTPLYDSINPSRPILGISTVIPYNNVTRTHGSVNCSTGDIVLVGRYINLGK